MPAEAGVSSRTIEVEMRQKRPELYWIFVPQGSVKDIQFIYVQDNRLVLVIVRRRMISSLAFVHLAMPPEVGHDRKVSPTAFNITRKSCPALVLFLCRQLSINTYVSPRYDCTYVFAVSWVE